MSLTFAKRIVMKKLYAHILGAILLGAVVVVGTPDSARAELDANVLSRIRTILQDPENDGFAAELTAFVLVVPEFSTKIAAAAARMRPDLALEIFAAVAAASPRNAVVVAAAIAGAVPHMRLVLKAALSDFLIANADLPDFELDEAETGQLASRYVPEIRTFLRGTLEDSIVVSPSI